MRGDSDVGQMLVAALDVTPGKNAVEASRRYSGPELRTAEETRAEQRTARMRELRNRFVDGPVLVVPSGGGGSFNAVGATPIPGAGTVYVLPYRQKGDWGTLDATNGVLVGDDGTRRLPGPARVDGAKVTGEGWTVTVANGWLVRSGTRTGDYQIIRDRQ